MAIFGVFATGVLMLRFSLYGTILIAKVALSVVMVVIAIIRAGNLLKTLEIEQYREIDGFWTIDQMTMTNADSGHSTTMELSDLRFNTGIEESTYTERTMTRRIR